MRADAAGAVGGWLMVCPLLRGGAEGVERREELLAGGGEGVAGGAPGDGSLDETFGLEFVEAVGEGPVGDSGDGGSDLGETGGSVAEGADDHGGPASADDLDGVLEGAAVGSDACSGRVVVIGGGWG